MDKWINYKNDHLHLAAHNSAQNSRAIEALCVAKVICGTFSKAKIPYDVVE